MAIGVPVEYYFYYFTEFDSVLVQEAVVNLYIYHYINPEISSNELWNTQQIPINPQCNDSYPGRCCKF